MTNQTGSVKPKVALYWAASCGGCETTVVDIGEPLLDVAAKVEFVLWPVALDFKYHHIKAMPDKSIDLCLFNGGIRTAEQEEMAHLLRAKSKILVAFGSCAHLGGIPGLADFTTRENIFKTSYRDVITVDKNEQHMPKVKTAVPEGELQLPEIYESVYRLSDIVDVDYILPGCPPTSEQVAKFLTAVLEGKLPPAGSVFGEVKNLCSECKRPRKEKKIKTIYRPQDKIADPNECLLDQGFFCMGPVTRAGCRTQCVNVNRSCRGCYGPTDDINDMGIAYLSALASVIDSKDEKEIQKVIDSIPDLAGTLYQFSLPAFVLKQQKKKESKPHG